MDEVCLSSRMFLFFLVCLLLILNEIMYVKMPIITHTSSSIGNVS